MVHFFQHHYPGRLQFVVGDQLSLSQGSKVYETHLHRHKYTVKCAVSVYLCCGHCDDGTTTDVQSQQDY